MIQSTQRVEFAAKSQRWIIHLFQKNINIKTKKRKSRIGRSRHTLSTKEPYPENQGQWQSFSAVRSWAPVEDVSKPICSESFNTCQSKVFQKYMSNVDY